jgi:hypothetical protein
MPVVNLLPGSGHVSPVIPLDPTPAADFLLTVEVPADAALRLRLAGVELRTTLLIRHAQDEAVSCRTAGGRLLLLLPGGRFRVRWSLSFGLVRVRAWAEGQDEPACWLATAYTGQTGWTVRMLTLARRGEVNLHALTLQTATIPHVDETLAGRAAVLERLARELHALGDSDLAVSSAARAVELWRSALEVEHPRLGVALNNLAQVLCGAGERGQALALQRQALAIQQRTLGADHPDTGVSLFNLARLLARQGELTEARGLFGQALKVFRTRLGPRDRRTVACVRELLRLSGEPRE